MLSFCLRIVYICTRIINSLGNPLVPLFLYLKITLNIYENEKITLFKAINAC